MEPLTAGAIALVTLLLNKTFEKTGEIIVAKAFEQGDKVLELFKHKSRDTADALEAAVKNAALPQGQREDIGEAVLLEKIKSAAHADPEIKAAVEALASDVDAAAQKSPQLTAVIQALEKAVISQSTSVINENWQGINFKNANPTISNNTFKFGDK
ncbi:MAG: hypothetical protein ACYTXE_35835 [Nostoc sp.]